MGGQCGMTVDSENRWRLGYARSGVNVVFYLRKYQKRRRGNGSRGIASTGAEDLVPETLGRWRERESKQWTGIPLMVGWACLGQSVVVRVRRVVAPIRQVHPSIRGYRIAFAKGSGGRARIPRTVYMPQ